MMDKTKSETKHNTKTAHTSIPSLSPLPISRGPMYDAWNTILGRKLERQQWNLLEGVPTRRKKPSTTTSPDVLVINELFGHWEMVHGLTSREIVLADDVPDNVMNEWVLNVQKSKEAGRLKTIKFVDYYVERFTGATKENVRELLSYVKQQIEFEKLSRIVSSWVTEQNSFHTEMSNISTQPEPSNDSREASSVSFIDSIGCEYVLVFVGKEEAEFYLRDNRAATISEYFRQTFDLASPNNNKIWLQAVSVGTFELFGEWLYEDTITLPEDHSKAIEALLSLYFFSSHIESNTLHNRTIDEIQDRLCARWFDEMVDRQSLSFTSQQLMRIFQNTLKEATRPLRKLCAALVSYWMLSGGIHYQSSNELGALANSIPSFIQEFADYQAEIVHRKALSTSGRHTLRNNPIFRGVYKLDGDDMEALSGFNICFFHVHKKGERCDSSVNHVLGQEAQEIPDGIPEDFIVVHHNMELEWLISLNKSSCFFAIATYFILL